MTFKRAGIGAAIAVFTLAGTVFVTPGRNVGAAASGCVAYTYAYGGYSTCIRYIQRMINGINNTKPGTNWAILAVDGSFGNNTNNAVRAYQSYKQLAVDGRVGPNTWQRLCIDSWEDHVIYNPPEQDGYNAGVSANCISVYPEYYNP